MKFNIYAEFFSKATVSFLRNPVFFILNTRHKVWHTIGFQQMLDKNDWQRRYWDKTKANITGEQKSPQVYLFAYQLLKLVEVLLMPALNNKALRIWK